MPAVAEEPQQKPKAQRISDVMAELDLSPKEVADACGVHPDTAKRWQAAENEPYNKYLEMLSDAFDVRQHWLKTGEGEMLAPAAGDGAREARTERPAQTKTGAGADALAYQLVEAGAGPPRDNGSEVMLPASPEQIRSAVGYVPAPEHAFWCRIAGDSMAPWLSNGEIVLAQECQSVEVAGRYVYWLDDHEGHQVKHFEPLGEGDLRITQYGPTPRTEEYEHEEGNCWRDSDGRAWRFRICGRVIYPADTGRSLLETTTRQLKDMLREQAAGYASKDE
jgi:phage repressor protein C with HTH and peptisase S24 domain